MEGGPPKVVDEVESAPFAEAISKAPSDLDFRLLGTAEVAGTPQQPKSCRFVESAPLAEAISKAPSNLPPKREQTVLVPKRTCSGDGLTWCYRPHGCGEAGRRLGSLCAIEVEGLKRRPPTPTVHGRPMP